MRGQHNKTPAQTFIISAASIRPLFSMRCRVKDDVGSVKNRESSSPRPISWSKTWSVCCSQSTSSWDDARPLFCMVPQFQILWDKYIWYEHDLIRLIWSNARSRLLKAKPMAVLMGITKANQDWKENIVMKRMHLSSQNLWIQDLPKLKKTKSSFEFVLLGC